MSLFVSSIHAANFPVLDSTGSRNVMVGLLAYTFLRRSAVGSSGADGSTKTFRGIATQVPCVKLRAGIARLSTSTRN